MVADESHDRKRPRSAPAGAGSSPEAPGPAGPAAAPPARGIRRVLYVVGGLACVGLAYLGAILPGLPTTPWVLLASYCFGRSSPRLQRWLRRSPLFGRLLRDWDEHRGIRRPVKVFAVGLMATVVTTSIMFGGLPVWAKWVIGCCAACGAATVLFVVPTISGQRSEGRDPQPVARDQKTADQSRASGH